MVKPPDANPLELLCIPADVLYGSIHILLEKKMEENLQLVLSEASHLGQEEVKLAQPFVKPQRIIISINSRNLQKQVM